MIIVSIHQYPSLFNDIQITGPCFLAEKMYLIPLNVAFDSRT